MTHVDLVEQIYEAAFVPDLWPSVLEGLSACSGSLGGVLFATRGRHPPRWVASAAVAPAFEAYAAGGACQTNRRLEAWSRRQNHRFLRDIDLVSPEELAIDPMLTRMQSDGLGWQLGTVIPMPSGEVVVCSLERRRADGPHDEAMRATVDAYRPHIVRAGLIAARLGVDRASTAVSTLSALGMPAAVLTAAGKIVAANRLLQTSDHVQICAHERLSSADRCANALLADAIGYSMARSIPLPACGARSAAIIQIIPLAGIARDMFSGAAILVVVSTLDHDAAPEVTLLQGLFDLTPAEAKLAARIAEGMDLTEIATLHNASISTLRTHLKSVFRKTGVKRQSQLVMLLEGTRGHLCNRT